MGANERSKAQKIRGNGLYARTSNKDAQEHRVFLWNFFYKKNLKM